MTRLILICATSLVLFGCTPQHTKNVSSEYCQIYSPVRASRLDTSETRRQVRNENAKYDALCVKQAAESMLSR